MANLMPRRPMHKIAPELRKAMDHSQPHVELYNLAINCGDGGCLNYIEMRNAEYREWKKINPDFDDSCPF
jgi:hypothetical protein